LQVVGRLVFLSRRRHGGLRRFHEMFFALCPGPLLSLGELFELLMLAAAFCSLPLLAALAYAKWVGARRERSAERYSLHLNDRRA
jgi:hypothetical protein